jgi:hypothetical protein
MCTDAYRAALTRDFSSTAAPAPAPAPAPGQRPALVAAWLEPRIHQVSGVTLREALTPLPPATRDSLLAARAAIKATGAS